MKPFTLDMPKLSPTMEEGTIAKWHKKEGEYIKPDTLLLEIITDKATVEYQAIDEGWLRKILLPEGASAAVNEPLAIFTEEEKQSLEGFHLKKPSPPEPVTETKDPLLAKPATKSPAFEQPVFTPYPPLKSTITSTHQPMHASPLARRLAEEKDLDLTTIKGSGPEGRITSKDLEKAQPKGLVTFGREEQPTLAPGTYREIPLTPMRKVIARRLQESKSFIPHFYVKQVINAEPMTALREQLKAVDLKVTFNDMIIRASALALRQHPEINCGFNNLNQTLIQFKTIDISLAVSFEGGLITPIIRHADYKNLGQLSKEAKILAEKARSGKLQEHEYQGGSFCLSNLGMFGVTEFSAVINPPQAAILAVGAIESCAVVKNGEIIPGKQLALTLSVNHQVIDGALAAQFLRTIRRLLENPVSIIL